MSTLEEISLIGDGSQKQMLCEQFIRRAIEGEDVSLCREYVDYGGFENWFAFVVVCLFVFLWLAIWMLVGFLWQSNADSKSYTCADLSIGLGEETPEFAFAHSDKTRTYLTRLYCLQCCLRASLSWSAVIWL